MKILKIEEFFNQKTNRISNQSNYLANKFSLTFLAVKIKNDKKM